MVKKDDRHPQHSTWLDRNQKLLLCVLGVCLLLLIIFAITSVQFLISDIRIAALFMVLFLLNSIVFYVLFPYSSMFFINKE